MSTQDPTLDAALEAIRRGYQPIPIRPGLKKPLFAGWPQVTWDPNTTAEEFQARIKEWGFEPGEPYNLGVILGPTSGHLVDVDIDHPKARRFRDLLPRTNARSGRPGSPDSHYWYVVTGSVLPSTRRYLLADGQTVTVEFRYNRGVQTIIPPSDWVPKNWEEMGRDPSLREIRTWSREPWGGASGPAVIDGRKLALQVALVGLCTVLLEAWPSAGSRHEAYLALAGGLLRMGDGIVHPFWEANAGVVIRALATATLDDDGPDAREHEAIDSTIRNLRDGKFVWGFPKLASLTSDDEVSMIRTLVAEIESLAGFQSRQAGTASGPTPASPATSSASAVTGAASSPSSSQGPPPADGAGAGGDAGDGEAEIEGSGTELTIVEHVGSWAPVDLEPYLSGQYQTIQPTVLKRTDGKSLFYPGRLNMLFAPSESGKTLLALWACLERIREGERALYIDFEDEPVNTIERLRAMGAGDDELRTSFTYVRPDEPIAGMQRDSWGGHKATPVGERNAELFAAAIAELDPAIIIADGMTSIYGLHGLDSNNSVETDVITSWLKSLSRNGRTTTIVIDHMAKSAERGSMPIGSQHKVSMVQGTLLQVMPKKQPMLGAVGELELVVLKDRIGEVRRHSGKMVGRAQTAAIVGIDSTASHPDGRPITVITVNPPPAPSSGGTGASGTLQVDLSNSQAAFRKIELKEARRALFLSAFDNVAGRSLSGKEILAKIGATWKAMKWTQTALETTRDSLISDGAINKTGGERGPNVRYELVYSVVDPPDVDALLGTLG